MGLAASIIIVLVFLTNFSLNLGNPIDLSHFDAFHPVFTLNHYYKVLESGNFGQILTVPMFYGFENSLLFSELFLLQAILAFPAFLLTGNIIFTYNFLVLATMVFSFYTMYLFAFYLTKKIWPSILAAVIYSLNPFVFGHFPDNIHYLSLQWIPLIFLFLEKSLRDKKNKDIFLLFVFLTLQLLSSITYGALLTIVLPIYTALRLFQLKLNPFKLINKGFIAGTIVFCISGLGFGLLYLNYYSKQPIGRSLEEATIYGPWVSDLFFANPNNLIYGNLRNTALERFPDFVYNFEENAERNLLWGMMPFILFILSFKLIKGDQRKLWSIFAGMVVFNMLISLGPVIRISKDISLPGVYTFFYSIDPILHNLRVASRFSIFTFFFLGLICAFSLKKLTEKQGSRVLWISLLIVGIVIIEYFQKPLQFYQIPNQTRSFYNSLDKREDIKVILELPMGNLFTPYTLSKNQFVDANYMFWASTLHSKELLNGYSSYTPPEYIKRIELVTVNFPNPNKLNQLKNLGVDAIIMHRDEFKDVREFEKMRLNFKALGLEESEAIDGLVLVNLKAWKAVP